MSGLRPFLPPRSLAQAVAALQEGKQDKDAYAVLPYATTVVLDFAGSTANLLNLGGNVSITTTNQVKGKAKRVFLMNSTNVAVNLAFPSAWKFLGSMPLSLAAGKSAVLSLECVTATASEGDVWAGYNLQV